MVTITRSFADTGDDDVAAALRHAANAAVAKVAPFRGAESEVPRR